MVTTEFGVEKDIRIAPENCITLPAQVGSVVKAGTPLKGDLKDRSTTFVASTTDPNCVLLHSDGNGNGTIIIQGTVDMLKMDSDVQELITSTVETALAGKIYFIKGAK